MCFLRSTEPLEYIYAKQQHLHPTIVSGVDLCGEACKVKGSIGPIHGIQPRIAGLLLCLKSFLIFACVVMEQRALRYGPSDRPVMPKLLGLFPDFLHIPAHAR